MGVRLLALSLLATAIFVPAAGAAATSGGIGVRLVDLPTPSRNPLARSYIVGSLAPGTSVRRRVEIRNSTRAPANVVVYPGAAHFRRGNFSFASGRTLNELAAWTSVSRSAVRLQPGTSVFETVTINVPKSASSGERYAVIWAAVSGPAPAGGGVTLVNRVGVRMYVSVGPGGAPPSSFAIGVLTALRSATGEPLVAATVRNSGRQTLDIGGTLDPVRRPGRATCGAVSRHAASRACARCFGAGERPARPATPTRALARGASADERHRSRGTLSRRSASRSMCPLRSPRPRALSFAAA